jgi:Polysaccharide deacetylase
MRRALARLCCALVGFIAVCAFAAPMPILLVRSEATQQYFAAGKGDYAKILETWRAYFNRSNTPYKEVNFTQLRQHLAPAVLVLPSAVVLATAEKDLLEQKMTQGFSVLGTWAAGVRDEQGQWLGYANVERWFNAKVLADVRAESEDRFLLPYGDTPLTLDIPAGKRIYLGKIADPMLRVQAANGAGRYSVWARESYPAIRRLHALSFDESQKARKVYFGFPETAWLTAGPVLDQLVAGSIAWLARQPKLAKAAWPAPADAAFFLEMDTEDKYDNALVLARHLEARQLRSTFYSVSDVALKSRATVLQLAEKHEIALHGDLHVGFRGQPLAQQQERFSRQFAQFKELLQDTRNIKGFRAPLEDFDATTEQVMRAAGVRHHVSGVNASDDLLPFFSQENGKPLDSEAALVIIPRGLLDDINYVRMGISDPTHVGEVMQGAFDDVVASRGLGLFSVHSQNFMPGGVLDRQVPALLDSVVKAKGKIWFPTGTQLEQWWRVRERVQVSSKLAEQDRVDVRLKVLPGALGAIKKLRLTLTVPNSSLKPVLENLARGLGQTEVLALDSHRYGVVFDSLEPGEYQFSVRFR